MSSHQAPVCPLCGQAMEQRRNQWGEFWGCCDYPDCRGLIRIGPPRRGTASKVAAQAVRERQLTPDNAAVLRAVPPDRAVDAVAALRGLLGSLGAISSEI